MQTESTELSTPISLTDIVALQPIVYFDQERLSLQGTYPDELSAYRARRGWGDILEGLFLLERDLDFELEVQATSHGFDLHCRFLSACARYAFWRLTNNQAPEAQYVIETAHIPDGDSRSYELAFAADLSDKTLEGTVPNSAIAPTGDGSVIRRFRTLLQRFL